MTYCKQPLMRSATSLTPCPSFPEGGVAGCVMLAQNTGHYLHIQDGQRVLICIVREYCWHLFLLMSYENCENTKIVTLE